MRGTIYHHSPVPDLPDGGKSIIGSTRVDVSKKQLKKILTENDYFERDSGETSQIAERQFAEEELRYETGQRLTRPERDNF
ncbi:MAG: hypothetical protein PHY02_10860 [Phycisphaerae bacterium]|nr:hypothetical protein [Phycisphaerae bacterium]